MSTNQPFNNQNKNQPNTKPAGAPQPAKQPVTPHTAGSKPATPAKTAETKKAS
jgi:hypothetical protein